ncbi:hypothetical protein ACFQ1S_06780 [Kibdelosporangium lantanae]|uniref:Uncharacterized protein n=1 Tax=Kibdelosporangium lantanae TaxID=1497396 RepID=A0ABW3M8R7_9PSEU
MKRRYHVLRPGLDEDMVDQTEDVLLDLHGSGHPHYRLEDIQGNLDLAGHIFLADPSEPVVTVVRYARAGTWYVIVEGHDDDRVDEIADLLTARLPVLDIATLYCAAGTPSRTCWTSSCSSRFKECLSWIERAFSRRSPTRWPR